MAIISTPAQYDQLNRDTHAACAKAAQYKIPLGYLYRQAKKSFADDPAASRALEIFNRTAGFQTEDAQKQEDAVIGRAVAASHIRNIVSLSYHNKAKNMSEKEQAQRYLSAEVSNWEKDILAGRLQDFYEEQHGEEALDEILESEDAVDQIARSFLS